MRGSGPSFPKPKSPLFPKNKFLTLSRSHDALAKPISKLPDLALWDTFWNMFHF